MTIGKLNQRISVLEQSGGKDSFGGADGEWVVVGRVWANVNEPKNSNDSNSKMLITVRFYAGLSDKNRIGYNGDCYEITGIRDFDGSRRWTEISVKEIDDGKLQRKTEEA